MKRDNKPKLHCILCGYEWIPNKDRPVACPHCKRYDWNDYTIEVKDEVLKQ